MLESSTLIESTPRVVKSLTPKRLGTFRDNLKAPIHGWFKYPAGFSYKLVDTLISDFSLQKESWLLDPFVGCGTTSVVAKQRGINSVGIEAHPFVHWVAQVKCFWEYDMESLSDRMFKLLSELRSLPKYPNDDTLKESFPELIHKCYSSKNLWGLKFIRDSIDQLDCDAHERDFFRLALTDTLRTSSSAGTGWPYVAPSKYQGKNEQNGIDVFYKTVQSMYQDLDTVLESYVRSNVDTQILLKDSREPYPIDRETIDLAITSPPYLNNYDYADRTRLETYFFGLAHSWRDITINVRDKLLISATTQIRRSDFKDEVLSSDIHRAEPILYNELLEKISRLSELRLQKGGKKTYDFMVAGYFNGMFKVLEQVYRALKSGAYFVLVLGDSAPYGVHIPTEEYLGRLAIAIGFTDYYVQNLRKRGEKWKNNPQRHKVMLKEGILFIKK